MSTIKAEPAGASLTRPWPADQPERWSIERLIPLGQAKAMFDNVRGDGYGLREWRTPSG